MCIYTYVIIYVSKCLLSASWVDLVRFWFLKLSKFSSIGPISVDPACPQPIRVPGLRLKRAPSPPIKSLDFRGFDSSRLLIIRGGDSHVRMIL